MRDAKDRNKTLFVVIDVIFLRMKTKYKEFSCILDPCILHVEKQTDDHIKQ